VVARLAADSTIEVLVKSASDGQGRNWFLVLSQTGLLGWAEVDTVFKNVYPRRDDFEP
jgi:NOL1/NOP2/fmu family ribosome biogenesis protein